MGTILFQFKDQIKKDRLQEDFPFKILRYNSNGLKQPLHMHDYIQIAYVWKGMCNHRFRGKSLTVGKGDIFVIPPGMEHSLNAIEGKEFELILLDFLPFLVHDQLKPFSESLYRHLDSYDAGNSTEWLQPWLHIGKDKQLLVEQLLLDIQDEFEHREEGFEFSIRINLVKLLILIDREFRRSAKPQSHAQTVRLRPSRPFEDVIRYVYDNYSQDIPLEQGAYLANMTPAYFSHMFKKETGQTFVEFLHEVRIERAMELIRQDVHTMTQICFQVGFRHLSHFIRTFKKRTGLTPTEYKKSFATTKNRAIPR